MARLQGGSLAGAIPVATGVKTPGLRTVVPLGQTPDWQVGAVGPDLRAG